MSDKPLSDAPAQQQTHAAILAAREARDQREAQEDQARHEADLAHDAADDKTADEPAPVPLTPEQQDQADHEKSEADAAEKAEADKQARAEAGVTGAQNGDPAGVAFGERIRQAQFDHRNQGHDDTMALLDDMLAALQRLEAKAAGQ